MMCYWDVDSFDEEEPIFLGVCGLETDSVTEDEEDTTCDDCLETLAFWRREFEDEWEN